MPASDPAADGDESPSPAARKGRWRVLLVIALLVGAGAVAVYHAESGPDSTGVLIPDGEISVRELFRKNGIRFEKVAIYAPSDIHRYTEQERHREWKEAFSWKKPGTWFSFPQDPVTADPWVEIRGGCHGMVPDETVKPPRVLYYRLEGFRSDENRSVGLQGDTLLYFQEWDHEPIELFLRWKVSTKEAPLSRLPPLQRLEFACQHGYPSSSQIFEIRVKVENPRKWLDEAERLIRSEGGWPEVMRIDEKLSCKSVQWMRFATLICDDAAGTVSVSIEE